MKVSIKSFNVDMEVKNKGIEFGIRSPDDKTQLGDVYITKSGLTWCKGRITQQKGIQVSWEDFIKWMEASI